MSAGQKKTVSPLRRLLEPLSSLTLTVVLLVLSMLLVFAGTWAQAEQGLFTVLETYFRCWFARVEFLHLILPGGYLLGTLLLANLLAAHALRFQLTKKRAGVLLIHAGLVILLVGELVTSQLAVESRMEISEGQRVDWASSYREVELALVDQSNPDRDVVIAIPQRRLVEGQTITHPLLPCDLHVVAYYPNSQVWRPGPNEPRPAGPQPDAGPTAGLRVERLAQVAGAGGEGIDAPSALVRLEKDGQAQGTWLVSAFLEEQPLGFTSGQVPGGPWTIRLRFRRYLKPWSLQLDDFRHDRYTGTNVAKNFASHLRLIDPEQGVDREVVISMNEPLRYRGETIYQSAFKDDDQTTILQVVHNPGWTLPYIAVAIGALGMLLHFGGTLVRFLRRERKRAAEEIAEPAPDGLARAFPWIALGLGAAWLLWVTALRPAPDFGPYDLGALARVPVSYGGRLKPLDTVARNAATAIYGSESLRLAIVPDEPPARVSPIEWLVHTLARPEQAEALRVFKISNPDVLGLLGLPRENDPDQSAVSRLFGGAHPRRYSYAELLPLIPEIRQQARRADAVESRRRDPFQRAILELHGKLALYDELVSLNGLHPIPPLAGAEDWETLAEAQQRGGPAGEALNEFIAVLRDYHLGGDDGPQAFARDTAKWTAKVGLWAPGAVKAADVEVWFHRADPFGQARGLYLLAALLVAGGWLGWRAPLHRGALGLLILAVLIHTLGLTVRVWLMGRPPVTNLYSSALFVGWGVALASILLERLFKGGLGCGVGALVGWLTLTLSGGLASDGDTMAVLQAVLDTNFWLATHVVVITLGYAACFLAGFLGLLALLRGLCTRSLTPVAMRQMAAMTYGVVCFATLASFVGTILGGIWADQSWGRFWGWDPKENGALLIVLWNAVILHARWGGLVRERGLFLLAIGGNIVTAWSWFGTNMLGVGLHAYGFMDQALFWLLMFVFSQLALIGLGLIPTRLWRSDPWAKPQPATQAVIQPTTTADQGAAAPPAGEATSLAASPPADPAPADPAPADSAPPPA